MIHLDREVSDNCKNLIDKLLEKDPDMRINQNEILEHPWISDYYQKFITKEVSL